MEYKRWQNFHFLRQIDDKFVLNFASEIWEQLKTKPEKSPAIKIIILDWKSRFHKAKRRWWEFASHSNHQFVYPPLFPSILSVLYILWNCFHIEESRPPLAPWYFHKLRGSHEIFDDVKLSRWLMGWSGRGLGRGWGMLHSYHGHRWGSLTAIRSSLDDCTGRGVNGGGGMRWLRGCEGLRGRPFMSRFCRPELSTVVRPPMMERSTISSHLSAHS